MKTTLERTKDKTEEKHLEPDWEAIRSCFKYEKDYIQLATSQFLASHPKPVADAIRYYRRKLDEQPALFTQQNEDKRMDRIRQIASRYLGMTEPDNIALTSNTTMGLGTIYTGLNPRKGEEILTSEHDHYAHHESIRQATLRTGSYYRKVKLYKDLTKVTAKEIVNSIISAISPKTKIIGLTWVHSSTGLKLPISEIGQAIKKINAERDEENHIIFLVDGVHGFGIETESFQELGCDFFISGCHKWLYGPRGTGLIAATTDAWQEVNPVIPSFTDVMNKVIEGRPRPKKMDGKQMTPGGFQSFENKWALYDAFEFMLDIGKENIRRRVHQLAKLCKEGLASMPHVILHTPRDQSLSSGIISFEIKGYTTEQAVRALVKKKLVVTASPYSNSYVRMTPGIINTEEEINKALDLVEGMRKM